MHHPSTLQGLKRNSKVCLAACCATNAQFILPKGAPCLLSFQKMHLFLMICSLFISCKMHWVKHINDSSKWINKPAAGEKWASFPLSQFRVFCFCLEKDNNRNRPDEEYVMHLIAKTMDLNENPYFNEIARQLRSRNLCSIAFPE